MAKNSEVYKTAHERAVAFDKFCKRDYDDFNCDSCKFYPFKKRIECWLSWLDLEAEDEKPLPCPFCGAEVEFDHNCNVFNCTSCNYMSSGPLMNESAIAAHNRVAKKCREVKE